MVAVLDIEPAEKLALRIDSHFLPAARIGACCVHFIESQSDEN
jgi:hypothetical protein